MNSWGTSLVCTLRFRAPSSRLRSNGEGDGAGETGGKEGQVTSALGKIRVKLALDRRSSTKRPRRGYERSHQKDGCQRLKHPMRPKTVRQNMMDLKTDEETTVRVTGNDQTS